jgi:hypothetical protein
MKTHFGPMEDTEEWSTSWGSLGGPINISHRDRVLINAPILSTFLSPFYFPNSR